MSRVPKKSSILIVDDTKANIDVLAGLLKDDYSLKFALSGYKALELAEKFVPDLILLDVMMPELDGYKTCKRLKENYITKDIPVIFVTAKVEMEDEKKGFDLGAVDYITKPITPLIVKRRIETHLNIYNQKRHLSELVKEKTLELEHLNVEVINILGRASEFKDNETGQHIIRMTEYSYILAKALGLSKEQSLLIKKASSMHDVGKIGIADDILQKPGKLNAEEWNQIKKHPKIGYDIMNKQKSPLLNIAAKISYEHHEKWDGSGYPRSLKGIDISLESRIVALADVFDALMTKRPYKEPWPINKTVDLIKSESGKHFDPNVVEAFLDNLEDFIRVMNRYKED